LTSSSGGNVSSEDPDIDVDKTDRSRDDERQRGREAGRVAGRRCLGARRRTSCPPARWTPAPELAEANRRCCRGL